jgi:hypothetical protein
MSTLQLTPLHFRPAQKKIHPRGIRRMSTIAEILNRLSGMAVVTGRLAEIRRNVDRSLNGLLDHEQGLIRLETGKPVATAITPQPAPGDQLRWVPRK